MCAGGGGVIISRRLNIRCLQYFLVGELLASGVGQDCSVHGRAFGIPGHTPWNQWSPTFLAPGTSCVKDSFSTDQCGGEDGFRTIQADDCSHEIKRRLPLGRKVMTNLDSIFKSRDITLPTKVRLVEAMVFPVVMYECESWTVKKAEC